MILYVHGSPPFLLGLADKGEKSIDALEKSKQQLNIEFSTTYLETAQNTSEYEEQLQTLWGCSGISMKLLDHLFGVGCPELWGIVTLFGAHCVKSSKLMTTIMKMMTTVTRWLSQVFVVFTVFTPI